MRAFDLTPLYKSTVGFDHLASLLDTMAGGELNGSTYPPYNIERMGDNEYRISMAVAGFSEDDLNIVVKENTLTITGEKEEVTGERDFLHQGIAARSFERRFELADHVQVIGASMENGLLHVDLERKIPEAMKPRSIAITSGKGKSRKKTKTIEG